MTQDPNKPFFTDDSEYILCEVLCDTYTDFLNKKIDFFNKEKLALTGDTGFQKTYIMKNRTKNIIGGITGCVYFKECLYISALFVQADQRKKGIGSFLLKHMEKQAKNLGVALVHLDTFDWQAKNFYLMHGYTIFAVLEDCPKGYTRYYMKKSL